MTGIGLFARLLIGEVPDERLLLVKHAELILETPPVWEPENRGCDMYYWLRATQAIHQMGEHYWDDWQEALLEAALPSQRMDGAHAGSWDPVGPWGHAGGRVYSTAAMVLCLQASYRYERVLDRK